VRSADRELPLDGQASFRRSAVPPDSIQPTQIRRALGNGPVNEILVGLALLASSYICILFTRIPGGIALFWPGSAIAAALLIRLPRVRWISAAVSVVAALLVVNVVAAHRSWPIAALFTAVTLTEIAMMVAVFRAWRFPYPDITMNQAALITAVFGIAIPGVAAIGGGLIQHLNFAMPFMAGTIQWWSSHTIGACLLGPPILLFSVKGSRRLVQGRFLAVNGLTLLLCLVGCYFTIRYFRFPFVSLGLLLLIAAFRMGGLGASLMSLCFGLVILSLWILGIRPMGLDPTASTSGDLLALPVTGISNRAEFEERLRTVFGKARHLDRPAAVMAIDLDRFKAVNDAAGHAAGDAVLCKVAEACRLAVRLSDIVGRLGGDEFAIILDNCPEDRATDIGQQLLRALNPMEFEWKGSLYTIGASVGLAMNRGMADEKSWLDAADKACYIAKRDGRGLLRIATLVQSDELHTKQG
jgi:diguanylate cyclase (GGDEF)-like protein